jgi:hypothetical protein
MAASTERTHDFLRHTALFLGGLALLASLGSLVPLWIADNWLREAAQRAAATRYENSFPYEAAAARLLRISRACGTVAGALWLASGGLWLRHRVRAGDRSHARQKPAARDGEGRVGRLAFLFEQSGPAEQDLQNRLIAAVLIGSPIARAYLARVEADAESGVALCLRAKDADANIVRKVAEVFAGLFGSHEHLDVVFLTDSQELELRRVCAPFWVNEAKSRSLEAGSLTTETGPAGSHE